MATQPTLRRDFWVSGTDAMGYRTAANIKLFPLTPPDGAEEVWGHASIPAKTKPVHGGFPEWRGR